jgi:hypothetical protein
VGALADVRDEHEGEADGCGDVDDGEREERDVDDREGGAEGEGGLGGLERAEKEPGDDGERVRALLSVVTALPRAARSRLCSSGVWAIFGAGDGVSERWVRIAAATQHRTRAGGDGVSAR